MAQSPKQEFALPDPEALQRDDARRKEPAEQSAEGSVAEVLARNHDQLMQGDGVVMVGEGEDEIGRPAIVVGVKSRQQLAGVPRQIEGVRVMGWVVGEVDALGNPPRR
ncbi:hypothetical protein [Reyranella sp.]|uniref:hypothetical protein n=1 Tax=Reyranella sp. TaxID=1929291 RepID=UPI00120FCA97|nr:hypothetical protein [Reyranella sp.]TAJ88825.1 MAG: hypothetical protein EPO50_07185 [Reyranella sp.]